MLSSRPKLVLFRQSEGEVGLKQVPSFIKSNFEMGGGGLGWQEGGGETQITLNVLHCNTYETKNPPNQL
jgi:hypothetical protein